jgi:uncharacterized protein (UPF0261 family)
VEPTVAIIATLDTKGEEVSYLRDLIHQDECSTIVMDVGTLNPPTITPDISRTQVIEAAGLGSEILEGRNDRRASVQAVIQGASAVVVRLHEQSRLSAIISVGGGTGTHIGMSVMRCLPLGVPKLMVSTVASRDMSQLVGTKDIAVLHSVTDILGLNPISKRILKNAAAAVAGMALKAGPITSDKPIIGLTSFGFITEGAMNVKRMLEETGYEVAPFHANGTGGMAMEDLIDQGLIDGVLDFALHEFSDALYNGYCGGIGPGRLESAGKKGIPQVVVPGGLDCIVLEFDSIETMPSHMKGRNVFWYDFRSGVRTDRQDMIRLARTIGEKLNRSKGPVRFVVPRLGWSEADCSEGPLFDPETNDIFVSELKSVLDSRIPVIEVAAHINSEEFTAIAVSHLHELMKSSSTCSKKAEQGLS